MFFGSEFLLIQIDENVIILHITSDDGKSSRHEKVTLHSILIVILKILISIRLVILSIFWSARQVPYQLLTKHQEWIQSKSLHHVQPRLHAIILERKLRWEFYVYLKVCQMILSCFIDESHDRHILSSQFNQEG